MSIRKELEDIKRRLRQVECDHPLQSQEVRHWYGWCDIRRQGIVCTDCDKWITASVTDAEATQFERDKCNAKLAELGPEPEVASE